MAITLDGTTGITTPGLTNTGSTTIVALTTTGNTILGDASTDTLNVGNGNLVTNARGNVGVGVTPSAGWSGGFFGFQIGQTGAFASKAFSASNTQTFIGNNVYYNSAAGAYQYIATGSAAARYALNQATHIWQVAATVGTANTAISFTDAMTLSAAGGLSIGATADAGAGNILLPGTSGTIFGNATTSSRSYIEMYNTSTGNMNIATTFSTASITFSTGGTTTPTERVSISSAGVVTITRSGGSSFTAIGVYNESVGTANVSVGSDGRFTRATSSLKYKKNVLDAQYGLSDVLALRPVTYEGKNPVEEGITYGGLIAEEVHALGLSQFVEYADDGTPDAVRYGNMVSLAFKAIQEQQALIQSLTTRITALENK